MEFVNKEYFLLLLLLIPYLLWYFLYRRRTEPTMRMSDTTKYIRAPKSLRMRLVHTPMVLRCLCFVSVVGAMARPQTRNANLWDHRQVDGIDIMLALDVSGSMGAMDFEPFRIEAAKNVATEFISNRPDDNIGLVVFAAESFVQCPMTTDHASLLSLLAEVRPDLAVAGFIDDGTAIGLALANCISRLKDSRSKTKVVILLTDGANNAGGISPLTAAEIAKEKGVRVYTIGIGSNVGTRNVFDGQIYTYPIDEATLNQMAAMTDGRYYHATNEAELKQIYTDIDKLEKSKLDAKKFSKRYEAFAPFAMIALLSLILEVLLRTTWLRRIP